LKLANSSTIILLPVISHSFIPTTLHKVENFCPVAGYHDFSEQEDKEISYLSLSI
jgi:hypothetical protein